MQRLFQRMKNFLPEWQSGRQGSGYDKLSLFVSQRFKCDFYLLRFPTGTGVPSHTDPVQKGYNHYRINFVYRGYNRIGDRMYVLGKSWRFWRFVFFRPDLVKHGLLPVKKEMRMLSFGWLRKQVN